MIIPSSYRCAYYFEEISKIPHGSHNEKALSDYIVTFAKTNNLEYIQDNMANVIIYKPASPNKQNSDTVMIQAHIDMVDEKNQDSDHDFSKDPLKLQFNDGWISATGTTLGADDGMGVAYMLAILEDKTLNHPPLECVFTVLEEVGLLGAMNLKREYFKAKNFISLDGGGEVTTLISSAGGERAVLNRKYLRVNKQADYTTFHLGIRGLKGGHSGGSIDKELGNSNKLLARILYHLVKDLDIYVGSINGGLKDNAIPRESDAIISINNSDINKAKEIVEKQFSDIKTLFEFSDPGFYGEFASVEKDTEFFSVSDSKNLIKFLYLLPNGLRNKSMKIKDLTLTSLNLGIVETVNDEVKLYYSFRSAINECVEELTNEVEELAKLFDFSITFDAKYPGWNYKSENKLREKLLELFLEKYDYPMQEVAAHGGCECGIFYELLKPVDVISYGPKCEDIHTPKERLNLASFERCYDMLCQLLGRI